MTAGDDALASAAVAGIRDGMTVGLGTGRAAARGIRALARRVAAEELRVVCVATSRASAELAASLGLRVEALAGRVDHLFDGADEVDPLLRMLKGRGGAMTGERMVARAASRRIYLVQTGKLVARLGESAPLPIEIAAERLATVRPALAALGLEGAIRASVTDGGNPILDAVLPAHLVLEDLAAALDATPGVVGHGLFLDEADDVLIEDAAGSIERRTRPGRG